ncbi:glycosyltransferase family 2 protein [Actinotalea sp. JY-7876]|uniref:glycosyltransferase family 2 protein n=1 Tax=Actinotalea sp. JY-7876 TaxID=2758442 RepID=UPI0015F49E67|nr:glycosyltransferase family 2 protein [Actinotalea sp. JY-7876]
MVETGGGADGSTGVVAVVVTFRPEVGLTSALLAALAPQVDRLVVVDDGSPAATVSALRAAADACGATLLATGSNNGIAAAQNAGVAWAREHGARAVLLSDQDSLPAPDMVARLLGGLADARERAAAGRGKPVAAVGPVTMDERNTGAALLFSDHRWGPRRATVPDADGALVEATFLIASGCLVPIEVLDHVGPMNEGWFIDHIDLEWGLRARAAGYGLYGVVGAALAHSLGDRTQRIPGRERDVHIHSPARNYYMARNTVLLIRSGLLSAWWRWGYAAWITKYAVFYVLAVPPRARRARLLARGLWHGVRGRGGRLADTARARSGAA